MVRSAAVGGLVDRVEATIEMDIDLAAVVPGHLDLVVALLVASLGGGDPPAARGVEGRGLHRGRLAWTTREPIQADFVERELASC